MTPSNGHYWGGIPSYHSAHDTALSKLLFNTNLLRLGRLAKLSTTFASFMLCTTWGTLPLHVITIQTKLTRDEAVRREEVARVFGLTTTVIVIQKESPTETQVSGQRWRARRRLEVTVRTAVARNVAQPATPEETQQILSSIHIAAVFIRQLDAA